MHLEIVEQHSFFFLDLHMYSIENSHSIVLSCGTHYR